MSQESRKSRRCASGVSKPGSEWEYLDVTESEPLPEPAVPAAGELVLAGAFRTPTRKQWENLVLGVVRKAGLVGEDALLTDAETALETELPDGFLVRGLYTADDVPGMSGMPGVAPFRRGREPVRSGWDVRPLHRGTDAAATHRAVLDDLEGGASSIWLSLGGEGLAVSSLPEVLADVFLDLAPVVLDAGAETAAAAATFFRVAAERGIAEENLRGVLGADPLGLVAQTGGLPDFTDLIELAKTCVDRYPDVCPIVVSALPYVDAGATDAQELGLSLATGVAYLRALTEAGLVVGDAATAMQFRYAAGVDQFATIAKLRAARALWARVCEVSGVASGDRGQRQHAVTSPGMFAALDSHTNLIRATIATFAAGVGGADAITVLPFDSALGLPDEFSRRIARNTSALLIEESHIAAVADPAGGSWALEALTSELAAAGWAVFQGIEATGGMAAALTAGSVADLVAASAEKRAHRLSSGKEGIVGVTDFPDLAETPLAREPAPRPPGGGLPFERGSLVFEQLRARSAAAGATREQSAILLTVGAPRAAAKLAAGVEVLLRPGGVRTTTATLEAAPDLSDQVVVICAAPDASAADLDAAREAAADAAFVTSATEATQLGIIGVLRQVLAVLAPEEAA